MRVLDAGHRYALDNLITGGETVLQFYKDPALHNGDGYEGPSCQEVLRAVIDRVQELHRERPSEFNAGIIYDLRHAIAGFEGRAIIRRVEKDGLDIERVPVDDDGHLALAAARPTVDDEQLLREALEEIRQLAYDDHWGTPKVCCEIISKIDAALARRPLVEGG